MESDATAPGALKLPLTEAEFFADTLCGLAGGLEESVGLTGAAALIADVGSGIGEQISEQYSDGLGATGWSTEQLGQVLVDLKARIGGEFRVDSLSDDLIVLTATRCPFAQRVHGRASLCMMTTTVFGTISARATGYANVYIDEAIALGDRRCRVEIHLKRSDRPEGYEFFSSGR